MIHLYYWNVKPNVGDYFSFWLAKKLYKDVFYTDVNPNLIITGSILGHKNLNDNTIVWGAGWHNAAWSEKCLITNKENFKAVRGKLTANFLNLDLNKIALGDPGLLASKYFDYKNIIKKRKFLILCHWRDYDDIYEKYHRNYTVLNMGTNDLEGILKAICESEFVVSSSLHGIIFAHSFGIPAIHLEATNKESINNFKFKDYYSVLDIPYSKCSWENTDNFDAFFDEKGKYVPSNNCIKTIQNNLLHSLPKETDLCDNKICLCAIAKNENNYIREWVEHYKKLGFSHIVLFDNNDVAGEQFSEVIGDYIKSNYVEVKNVRGLANQQIKCYNDFYHSIDSSIYKWVAFFDIDEFLYLDSNKNIYQLLEDKKYEKYDAIAVNWKYFDDNDLVKVENNNYSITRFTREFKENDWDWAQHRFSKRIIKTGKELVINSSHGPIAHAQMNEYDTKFKNTIKVCNIAGKLLAYNGIAFKEWSYNGGYLAHYRFKTLEEYINCKMKRGYPTLYKNSGKDMSIKEFFQLNHLTQNKIEYIENLTNLKADEIKEMYGNLILQFKKETKQVKKPLSKKQIKEKLADSGLPTLEDSIFW